MKVFDSDNIRNIALAGHGDSGKTSLVSALLYSAGAVNRLGRVEDGNTITDCDENEIELGRNYYYPSDPSDSWSTYAWWLC